MGPCCGAICCCGAWNEARGDCEREPLALEEKEQLTGGIMGGCPVACIMAESARVLECATTIPGAPLEELTSEKVMQFVRADSSSSTSLN